MVLLSPFFPLRSPRDIFILLFLYFRVQAWEGEDFPRDPYRPLCNVVHSKLLVVVDWPCSSSPPASSSSSSSIHGHPSASPGPGAYTSPGPSRGPSPGPSATSLPPYPLSIRQSFFTPSVRDHDSYVKHIAALHTAATAAAAAADAANGVRAASHNTNHPADPLEHNNNLTRNGTTAQNQGQGVSGSGGGGITLQDCLKAFTSLEELDENSWYCDHCRKLSSGSVTSSLSRLPDILILHIKVGNTLY